MEPLITLALVTLVLFAAGAVGVQRLRPWPVALRGGVAAMFVLTGAAHFVGMREDLIDMVPPALPEPGLLITVTGVLELVGAVGVLWRRTAPWAAAGLSALLVAMFPANVYAAREGLDVGGAPAEALAPRSLMQLVFLAATLTVVVHHVRSANRSSARPTTPAPAATPAPPTTPRVSADRAN